MLSLGLGLELGLGSYTGPTLITLADIYASTIFDLSAQIETSTDDASTYWRNLIAAPADGAAQGDYDWTYGQSSLNTTGDPIFTGTPGDPDAYYLLGSNRCLTLETVPQFWLDAHKTTSDDFWVAISLRIQTTASQTLFATNSTALQPGIRLALNTDNEIVLYQAGSTFTFVKTGIIVSDNTDYIIVWSHNKTTNTAKVWINSATGTELSHTYNATTNDADAGFVIGAAGNYVGPLILDSRLYAFAGGSGYLSDAQCLAIQRGIAARQTEGRYPFL